MRLVLENGMDTMDVPQQTTNQTAVGVPQIQGLGKTNDLGTTGNVVKP